MLCLLHHLPRPRKRGSSRCTLHLFGVEGHPASPGTGSKSLLLSPAELGDISLKHTTQKPRKTLLEAFRGLMPPFLISRTIL